MVFLTSSSLTNFITLSAVYVSFPVMYVASTFKIASFTNSNSTVPFEDVFLLLDTLDSFPALKDGYTISASFHGRRW